MGEYSGIPGYPTGYTQTRAVDADARSNGGANGVEVFRQFHKKLKSIPSPLTLSPILAKFTERRLHVFWRFTWSEL